MPAALFGRRQALLAGSCLALVAGSTALFPARAARADGPLPDSGPGPQPSTGDDGGAPCAPDRLDQALRDIARARADVTTLSGPFVQERVIGLLAAKVRQTGTMTLVRPDRLRWELASPDEAVYWVTPEGLAYQTKSDHGRMQNPTDRAAAALEDLRILLSGDLGALRARYDLRGTCNGAAPIVFEATPKPGVASARRLVFSLAADLVSPQKVTIFDRTKDRTDITFGAMTKNAPVDPARMRPGF